MFDKLKQWFRRSAPDTQIKEKVAPFAQMPNNPGFMLAQKQDDDGNEIPEKLVLTEVLQQKLSENGWQTERLNGGWLYQADTGYYLLPLILNFEEDENGHIQTATTLQINHPELFPNGIFEFQYTFGVCETLEEALASGFDVWLKTDWETLQDAARPHQAQHLYLKMDFDGEPFKRLILLGSVGFYPPPPENEICETANGETHDEFCECCLFTQSLAAFEPLIKSHENYAIRIFVSRNGDEFEADCRVNGEDWNEAQEPLKNYAKTWSGNHTCFRKQYIIIRNQPDDWESKQSNHQAN